MRTNSRQSDGSTVVASHSIGLGSHVILSVSSTGYQTYIRDDMGLRMHCRHWPLDCLRGAVADYHEQIQASRLFA